MSDALHVCYNLRQSDLADLAAMREVVDLTQVAIEKYQMPGLHFAAVPGKETWPVMIGGIDTLRPRTATLWVLGTPDWKRMAAWLARFVRDELVPNCFRAGLHRIEAVVRSDNKQAVGFVAGKILGMTHEGTMRNYGQHGESFELYSLIREVEP